MKNSPGVKSNIPLFILLFLSSVFLIIGIMEFRFFKDTLSSYGSSIEQIAVNKTLFFLDELKATSINAAKKIEMENANIDEILQTISNYDNRITDVYLVEADGTMLHSLHGSDQQYIAQFIREQLPKNSRQKAFFSKLHKDTKTQLPIISVAAPLSSNQVAVLSFRLDSYQQELQKEFVNENYKLAVFDHYGQPIIWPFKQQSLDFFQPPTEKFYSNGEEYRVNTTLIEQTNWQLYLFQRENHFETLRIIIIICLIFALYYCLYQLLVEFWGVNTAKTYFDNIDFAIFNQINEGVIISNNAGIIIFANQAAHQIFAERKEQLRNVKLKELIGHVAENHETKSQSVMLKTTDRLLAVIHSPIIKNGKKLGSLSVIRVSNEEEKTLSQAFNKLIEIVSEGIIYVDKDNNIAAANLMANYYLGNLERGKNIAAVNSELAAFILENQDIHTVKRIPLRSHNVVCDIAPVHDQDGKYAGTLILLLDAKKGLS